VRVRRPWRKPGSATEEAELLRRRFVDVAADLTPYVAVRHGSDTYIVPTGDYRMGTFFSTGRRIEWKVLSKALAALAAAGVGAEKGLFIDGGANIGTTVLAALAAGFERVIAIEPDPVNVRLLRANVALNGWQDNVHVVEAALTNRAGTGSLELGRNRSMSRIVLDPGEQPVVDVTLLRLDDLVSEGAVDPASVGLLWLDIEGYETQALEGASAVLRRSPPLVMELHPGLLRDSGGLDRLPVLLDSAYTHVASLRRTRNPRLRPVADLPSLISRHEDGKTDLLLCRLDGPVLP